MAANDAAEAVNPKKRARAAAGIKRVEDWSREEVRNEIYKYTRSADAGTNAVCDELVTTVVLERQVFLAEFVADMGPLMDRYFQRQRGAKQALADFPNHPGIKALHATRGRVILLPVNIVSDDDEEAAKVTAKPSSPRTAREPQLPGQSSKLPKAGDKADKKGTSTGGASVLRLGAAGAKLSGLAGLGGKKASPLGGFLGRPKDVGGKKKTGGGGGKDDDDSSSSSDSDEESAVVEPSADHPPPDYLDNAELMAHLQTLMVESAQLSLSCIKAQEWLGLRIGTLDTEDFDRIELTAKLAEEFGEAREVANDRYEFYSTYLDVRAEIEANIRNYPDVQAYRETMVARDASAWEEAVRSWGLLRSSLAALNNTLAGNLKYIMIEDRSAQEALEGHLYM
jgi:hypothetical protein